MINLAALQTLSTKQLLLVSRLQDQSTVSPNAENLERFNLAIEGYQVIIETLLLATQPQQSEQTRSTPRMNESGLEKLRQILERQPGFRAIQNAEDLKQRRKTDNPDWPDRLGR